MNNNSSLGSQLVASVLASPEVVAAEVRDQRPESVALFGRLDELQRDQLAHDAWLIGLRALGNAHAAAQEARLHDVGEALLTSIDRQLKAHVENQQRTIADVLSRFFDPKDGQVAQRLAAFVDDQGVLAQLLASYLSPQNSVLAESLERHVGENSELLKKLSPTESNGLVKVLEGQLRAVMNERQVEILRALDPLAEDGAVARFLRRLRQDLEAAEADRGKQLTSAMAALDANNENSLLSRLVRETHQARQDVLNAVNPDAPQSPIAALKTTLMSLLGDQATRQVTFEKEIREALGRIENRRTDDQKSPRGGLDFEQAVIDFLSAATRGAPCVLDAVANTTGAVGRSKKGDAVLRYTAESAFEGVAVVFEAKREAGYTAQQALDELDDARKNRDAGAGVFVMARSHASESFPRFARHGNNVLVTWDEQSPATDPYLHSAIMLGMALVTRTKAAGDPGDIAALRDIEARIEAEVARLERMEKHNENIRRNSDGIGEEIRKSQKALELLVKKAQSTLRALNVEVQDEGAEQATPITLPPGSLDQAQAALKTEGHAA